jgi:ABC-type molybdate transport system substrate-binding protein
MAVAVAVVALTPLQPNGGAQSAEIRVLSSAAPRGVLRELTPDFEHTTGHRLAIHYEFAVDLKHRNEAGDPFDVAIPIKWHGCALLNSGAG